MKTKISNFISNYWLFFIIITQPILDIIAYFSFDEFLTPISFVTRSIYLLFIVLYTFVKVKNKKKYILLQLPFLVFSVLHLLNSIRTSGLNIFDDLRYLILVMQLPIVTISLCSYITENRSQTKKIEKGLCLSLIIICLSVILSIITKSFNDTYEGYGLTGWFTSANTQSMILVCLFPYCLYTFSKRNKYIYLLSLMMAFFLLFFNGTKACFYTLILSLIVMIYILLTHFEARKNLAKVTLTIVTLILSIIMFRFSSTFERENNMNNVNKENQTIIDKLGSENLTKAETLEILKTSYLYEQMINDLGEDAVYNEMKGKITADSLSDNRLVKRTYAKIIFERSDSLTKIVGFNQGEIEKYGMDLENDITAIFYYYGYLGFALYIIFILTFVILAFKLLIKNPLMILSGKFIVLSFSIALAIFGSEYSGALLRKPNANIYLALLLTLYFIYINKNLKDKKLKDNEITILSLHLGYGGIEQYLSSLCKILENNYKINIISTYKLDDKPALYFSDKIKITYLINEKPNREELKQAIAEKNILNIIKEGYKALKILYLKKYENIKAIANIDSKYIITTRDFHNKLVGTYAASNIIKIATEHNYHNNDEKYIKRVINSIKKFDYFIVVSNNLKEFYKDKIGKTKCIYIPNIIDKLPDKESNLKSNNIINIGRLESVKGQLELIDILKEVKKEIKDVKLYLIGDGSLRNALEAKVKENKLEDSVIFTGFLSKEKMEEYLIKSKLFVMTSYSESFGLVLIESMSYKVPCIAYDCADGPKELLKDDIGVLVKDRNQNLMVKEIIKLLKDNKLLKKYSNNAYKECQKYLSDNIKQEWLKILK